MSAPTPVTMSQGLEVLAPRSGQAFPIPCNEWDVLKDNISQLTFEPQLFNTIGSLLAGAALSTLIGLFTGAIPNVSDIRIVAWAVVCVCSISGIGCYNLASRERKLHRNRATEVVTQMSLIEQRFERAA